MLKSLTNTSNCLFVQATLPVSRFVLVQQQDGLPQLKLAGSVECDGVESLVAKVQEQVRASGMRVNRAVLLLPRGDVDVNSLRLPPATEDETPELVGNLLAQQVEDGATSVHDYVVSQTDVDGSSDVLTFSLSEAMIEVWKERFNAEGMKLEVITFGGIGAVSLLNQVSKHPAKTSVVVTATDQDTDLAVVENSKPVLFRTIPCATGDEKSVIDQLAGDIGRTLTLLGQQGEEEPRIYLIGTNDADQKADAQALHERLAIPVNLVNPLDQLSGDVKAAAKVARPSRFANLIGLACAWNNDALLVNLLDPKRPPPKPSLLSRFGFWGAIAASLLALGGYMLWEQSENSRIALEDQQAKLNRLIKPVKKSQTKQSIAAAVDAWQASEICWLDELQFLSENMPPADQARIGSLTMKAGQGGRGQIGMPVESLVSDVRSLEEALSDDRHKASCKRIVDASNRSDSVWRYQAMILVAPSFATQRPEKQETTQ